ncbi:Nucleolar protein 16 [Chionoecetes opilio]|uniref:Nucleolar protein 16 n=1 Tax=Chionoecetes opilio TaxID=41210 RepID=A0A8J4YMS7_CHIOP|nr:Nucleolar protein 16 [Chionoecetes opilio]
MGVRSRKKTRNKSRYRIASKRRNAIAKRKINPNIECSAVKSAWDSSIPASSNIANMGLVYNLSKVGIKSTRETLLAGSSKQKKDGISTTAAQQLQEEARKEAQKVKPGVRLTNSQVDYASAMVDKYGKDYKVRRRVQGYVLQD